MRVTAEQGSLRMFYICDNDYCDSIVRCGQAYKSGWILHDPYTEKDVMHQYCSRECEP